MSIPSQATILMIGVTYHSDKDAAAYIMNMLNKHKASNLSLIVVDNSSSSLLSQTMKAVAQDHENFSLLCPEHNLGYYGAATLALETHCSRRSIPDWTIVSNVDLTVREDDFFSSLIEYGEQHDFDIIAPSITSELSGQDQNPFMMDRPSSFRMHFYKRVFKFYPLHAAYSVLSLSLLKLKKPVRPARAPSSTATRPLAIYAPHGSFIAFRRSYFERGGTLNHPVFLFGEEIFVAETARRLGLTVGYDSRLEVIHREHKSTGWFPSPRISAYSSQAAAYCADHYF
jgi:GT2 family glycosyltransferase